MLVAIVPVLVLILGLLMYALCANPKLAEIGRMSFFVGLFWAVAAVAKVVLRLP